MPNSFELFDRLIPEIQSQMAQGVSTPDLAHLAQTSKTHLTLFKPLLDVRHLLKSKFLEHVVRGEYNTVQSILENSHNIPLISIKNTVTDFSGRTFMNISAFEYALWALDKPLWDMMLACLPHNEKSQKILDILILQYDRLKTQGVTYRLNGKTITEKHFDFENTIIKELQIQVETPSDRQWIEGVGGAQRLFPMHIVYEYGSKEPFSSRSLFPPQPTKTLSNQFYHDTSKKLEHWFAENSTLGLGVDFAIYKGGRSFGCCALPVQPGYAAVLDLAAMTVLHKTRTEAFIALESQFKLPVIINSIKKLV